jgi:hypothetical protein
VRVVWAMGVRLLIRTSTDAEEVVARLERLGGARSGSRWRVQCAYMLPRSESLQELFLFQSSEAPHANQLVYRGESTLAAPSGHVRVLEAGAGVSATLDLVSTHVHRLKALIEGSAHQCGDYVVRLGQLFLNTTSAGTAVEVEYLACDSVSAAMVAPLEAFAKLLLPPAERDFCSSDTECYRDATGLPAGFGPAHSALLLVGLMRARLGVKEAA